MNAKVVEASMLSSIKSELEKIIPMKAVFDKTYVKNLEGTNVKNGKTKLDLADAVLKVNRIFQSINNCTRMVMVWCGSTEKYIEPTAVHQSIQSFEEVLRKNDPTITPSMIFAYAAIKMGIPYANGAPNLTCDIPALIELSKETGTPIGGKDFKTGQTLMKTIVAHGLQARALGVNGWFSTNILGNRDGLVLDDPDNFKTKEVSKLSVLEQILQPEKNPELYGELYHKVRINYYPPHGDNKESWDNIDIFGWMGYHMQIKINFLCRDSILAAPIVLDLALFMDLAKVFLEGQADTSITDPQTFEEQALRFVGQGLYEAFFKGYTIKQWGCQPSELPASILKRLPVRFNYDDNYFFHKFQGMPESGYTAMIARILDHENITVSLNTPVTRDVAADYDHVFYSGPIDGWFGYDLGRLGYRTLDFERFDYAGDYQGCAVMNYGDVSVPYTRITEHKHFAPWESHEGSVLYREFSRECGPDDIPYYPIRQVAEKTLLADDVAKAEQESNVTFVGLLGAYRYLDMDVTIREALDCGRRFLARAEGEKMPAFTVNPL